MIRGILLTSVSVVAATSAALAGEKRALDAHEHGVVALNIAIDGTQVSMELEAPGADIVGFEHKATTDAQRTAIDGAIAELSRPMELFVLPASAECSVTKASAALEAEMDEHGHEEHAHDEHAHDDHAHDEQAHDEHAHDDHAHDEHTHDEHAEGAQHTEFHATYALTCAHPEKLSEVSFAFFEKFENTREIEVQVVTGKGAQKFEVEPDAPVLNLESLLAS